MPIYEYKCGNCGVTFEVLQKFTDMPPEKCPECKSKDLSRQVSSGSFRLTGTGWYKPTSRMD